MDYVNLIEDMNQNLYEMILDKYPKLISFIEENPPLELTSIGYAHNINFFGITIWCSENDERPTIDWFHDGIEDEKCIPLEGWLWMEIKRILSLISQLNKVLKDKNENT